MAKRGFDLVAAALGLIVFSPLLVLGAILVLFSGTGPIFFRQERVGRRFRPFRIYKFRTMFDGAQGPPITFFGDRRITPSGRFLRRAKLDELPQLFNVIKGEMSLVGPRPEVAPFVEQFRADYEEILRVRPGITDEASIVFRHEDRALAQAADPQAYYVLEILPRKIALAKDYVRTMSLGRDLSILLRTLARL